MTKKLRILGLVFLLSVTLFLNGCDLGGNIGGDMGNDTVQLPNNEITAIMKNFAKKVNLKNNDIKEGNFYWYNFADPEFDYEIGGYSITKSGINPYKLISMIDFFDGWHVEYVGDGMGGYMVEYFSGNIICNYGEFLDQEIPYEIMAWEGDFESDELDKLRDDFYSKATYNIDLSCGYIPQGAPNFDDFYFDAFGEEPFWNMSIRGSEIKRFAPEKAEDYYIYTLKKDGDNFHFDGYDIVGDIVKEDCVDGGKGDTHEYKITGIIEGDIGFMGCADKYDTDFFVGEAGTLGNFVKKTNYQYKGNTKREYMYYDVFGMINNYMYASLYQNDEVDYEPIQLIMEKTENGWKVLYEGSYEVDYDKCEELLQYDNNLMEMFFLRNCPRG